MGTSACVKVLGKSTQKASSVRSLSINIYNYLQMLLPATTAPTTTTIIITFAFAFTFNIYIYIYININMLFRLIFGSLSATWRAWR